MLLERRHVMIVDHALQLVFDNTHVVGNLVRDLLEGAYTSHV